VIKTKKSLGQNFLTDKFIISRIIETVNPKKEEVFFEIGSGKGDLTKGLISRAKSIQSVEIDKDLVPYLKKIESSSTNLVILENSVLKIDLKKLSKGKSKFRVIGNLPYNLSSKIMLWTFKNSTQIIDIHYMFQKEFGQRLVSTPGKKTYGRLSVLTQYMFSSRELFTILPESFTPVPSVESVFIRLQPKPKKDINSLEAIQLQELTKLMFSKRRKKISNSCKDLLQPKEFINLGIDPDDRPESLEVNDFLKITKYLSNQKHG